MLEIIRLIHTSALSSLANFKQLNEPSIKMILISNNTVTDLQLIADNPSTTNILQKEINNAQQEQ